jgi:hypothetical protein
VISYFYSLFLDLASASLCRQTLPVLPSFLPLRSLPSPPLPVLDFLKLARVVVVVVLVVLKVAVEVDVVDELIFSLLVAPPFSDP